MFLEHLKNYQSLDKKVMLFCSVIAALLHTQMPYYNNFKIITFLGCFLFVFLTSQIFKYLYEDKTLLRDYIVIAICDIFAMLPFLVCGYFYHDDLWNLSSIASAEKQISVGIMQARPFIGLWSTIFSRLTIEDTVKMRALIIFFSYLYNCIIYKYCIQIRIKKNIAFLVTLSLGASVIMVDIIGYMCIFPVVFALVYTSFSYIKLKEGISNSANRAYNIIVAVLSLLTAFFYYQIITPIFTTFLVLDILFDKAHNTREFLKKKLVAGVITYGGVSVLYLLCIKACSNYYGIAYNSSRANIVHEWAQIINKIIWFVREVLPQSALRIYTIFVGNSFLVNNCMFYHIQFKIPQVELVLLVIIAAIFIFLLYTTAKKLGVLDTVLILILIPVSFFCFLILPESTFLIYYALPLISLLVVLFLYFLSNMITYFKINNIVYPFIIGVILLNSNVYASKFWVNYNRVGYDIIKNVIAENYNSETQGIHIVGTLNPLQASIYPVFATRIILQDEFGKSYENFKITSSDNEYYISVIQKEYFDKMLKNINGDEKQIINKYYNYGVMYKQYYLNNYDLSTVEKKKIQTILRKGELLPNSSNVITVNLNKTLNKFYHF